MHADDAELAARLKAELERLQNSDSLAVLGLRDGAGQTEIRAAYLQATKHRHPNRFARNSREVVRLSNEIFLIIKGAYQELTGVRRRRRLTTNTDVVRTRPRTTGLRPRSPTRPPPRVTPEPTPVVTSRATPRVTPRPSRPTNPRPTPRSTEPGGRPGVRERRRSTGPVRTATTLQGSPPPPPEQSRPQPRIPPRTRVQFRQQTRPGRPGRAATERSFSGTPSIDDEFRRALQLCKLRQWSEARRILQTLALQQRHDPKFQVYLHYVQGQELVEMGNTSYALDQFRRALDIDPSFELARHAANSLQEG